MGKWVWWGWVRRIRTIQRLTLFCFLKASALSHWPRSVWWLEVDPNILRLDQWCIDVLLDLTMILLHNGLAIYQSWNNKNLFSFLLKLAENIRPNLPLPLDHYSVNNHINTVPIDAWWCMGQCWSILAEGGHVGWGRVMMDTCEGLLQPIYWVWLHQGSSSIHNIYESYSTKHYLKSQYVNPSK